MNLASAIIAAAAAILGGGVGAAIVNGVFNRDGQRAAAAETNAKAAKEKAETVASDHKIWQEDASAAYKRIEVECGKCTARLNVMSTAFYELLDDLNDIDSDDPRELRAQVRSAARKARTVTVQ